MMGKRKSHIFTKPLVLKILLVTSLILTYKVLENSKFDSIDSLTRDSLQFLNRPNEVDNSFVTLTININSDGITTPHTYDGMKRIIDSLQATEPKNIIVMMEPLDFVSDKKEKQKLFDLFTSQDNLFLNKYEARNALATFGNDELFKDFKRFIHFYKCSDSPKERENRRALISLTSFGDAEIFNDIRLLGYTPKNSADFEYSFDYWNSRQVYLKNYPLGTFGNFQSADLLSNRIDPNVFKNKTVLIGTNDEFSHLVSKSTFYLFGMKSELEYQKNWIPLQDVLANNLSLLTKGTYIKLLSNFDDLLIVLLVIFLIIITPIKFDTKLYFFMGAIPTILALEVLLYSFGSYYINFSRSLVVLVLGQYFILPLTLLWKFRKQEEEKYIELNKIRINALISVAEHVAHDLRSPLSTVNLLMHKAAFQNVEHRNLTKSALSKIDNIIEKLLSSTKSRNQNLILVDLSQLIQSLVFEKRIEYPKINFEFPEFANLPSVYSDEVSLTRVFSNIIDNSIEALLAAATSNAKISISALDEPRWIKLDFSDNGPGIKPEILKILGIKQISFESKTKGHGIGILYSKKMIEDLGGKLLIHSEGREGTVVSIYLPKP